MKIDNLIIIVPKHVRHRIQQSARDLIDITDTARKVRRISLENEAATADRVVLRASIERAERDLIREGKIPGAANRITRSLSSVRSPAREAFVRLPPKLILRALCARLTRDDESKAFRH